MNRVLSSIVFLLLSFTCAIVESGGVDFQMFSGANCGGEMATLAGVEMWNIPTKLGSKVQSIRIVGSWILYDKPDWNRNVPGAVEYYYSSSLSQCIDLGPTARVVASVMWSGSRDDANAHSLWIYTLAAFQGMSDGFYESSNVLRNMRPLSFIISGSSGWTLYDQPDSSGKSICVHADPSDGYSRFFPVLPPLLPFNFHIRSVKLGC